MVQVKKDLPKKVGLRVGIDRRAENNVGDEKDVGDKVEDLDEWKIMFWTRRVLVTRLDGISLGTSARQPRGPSVSSVSEPLFCQPSRFSPTIHRAVHFGDVYGDQCALHIAH